MGEGSRTEVGVRPSRHPIWQPLDHRPSAPTAVPPRHTHPWQGTDSLSAPSSPLSDRPRKWRGRGEDAASCGEACPRHTCQSWPGVPVVAAAAESAAGVGSAPVQDPSEEAPPAQGVTWHPLGSEGPMGEAPLEAAQGANAGRGQPHRAWDSSLESRPHGPSSSSGKHEHVPAAGPHSKAPCSGRQKHEPPHKCKHVPAEPAQLGAATAPPKALHPDEMPSPLPRRRLPVRTATGAAQLLALWCLVLACAVEGEGKGLRLPLEHGGTLLLEHADTLPAAPAPSCPKTCASTAGLVVFRGKASAVVPFGSLQVCQRACHINQYPYYAYTSSTDSCSCYKTCNGTKVDASGNKTVIGLSAKCPYAFCPRSCATSPSTTYIAVPPPTYSSQQPSLSSCQNFCANIGSYYTYNTVSTCSCYSGCLSVVNLPGSVPTQMGQVSQCFKTPSHRRLTCSAYVSRCPTCYGKSRCVVSASMRLQLRYQCCCVNGTRPYVRYGRMIGCF